jgi:hypothetical protein
LLRSSREGNRKMGRLLVFTPHVAAKPRPKPALGTTASIIIFPGVRYEQASVYDRAGAVRGKPGRPKPGPAQY